MTAPTLRQFTAIVDELLGEGRARQKRLELLREYEWTYNAAHHLTVQDLASVNPGAPTTPTETVVLAKAHMRRACETAVKRIEHATADVEEALRRVELALESLDPKTPDPPRFIWSASREDVEESRRAQERRAEAGEAVP